MNDKPGEPANSGGPEKVDSAAQGAENGQAVAQQLAELKAENAELRDKLLRSIAEMENLRRLMEVGVESLKPAGRIVVVSFQSMEDRQVKQAFRSLEQAGMVRVLTAKPVVPDQAETARNPRSRSAKLRAAIRTDQSSARQIGSSL